MTKSPRNSGKRPGGQGRPGSNHAAEPGDPDRTTSALPGTRVNRWFTENGVISRREADRAIADGRIQINGRTAQLGDRVLADDTVTLDGKRVGTAQKRSVILAYHKPVGIECTSDAKVVGNIIDAVGYPERVFHIGRLDKMSEGLILLTNMGEIVNKVLRARFYHEKEYEVKANGPFTDAHIRTMQAGMELEDGRTRPCEVTRINARSVRMVLTEGRNRQIRRMVDALDLRVSRLKRVRIMNVELGDLPVGKWRKFSPEELANFLEGLGSEAPTPLGSEAPPTED